MTDLFDLTTLTDEERGGCSVPPAMGELCHVARVRSEWNLRPLADDVGVSHVTLLAWERRSDHRLVEYWERQGYRFPDDAVVTAVVLVGKSRYYSIGAKITDRGVTAEWSGMRLVRRHEPRANLDEHEYVVDEERGVYRFSKSLHGRRSIAVSYSPR